MKVFGIGLNKTGTTTLRDCLLILGYTVKGFDRRLTYQAVDGQLGRLLEVCEQYDAFQDFPWPLIYQALDKECPGSKFVLTTRSDSNAWFDSMKRHAYRTGPRRHRGLIYGHDLPYWRKKEHVAVYERHNAEARRYFKSRPNDFLEICWERDGGWAELCEFLARQPPPQPLPHANPSGSNRAAFRDQLRTNRKTCRYLLGDIKYRLKHRNQSSKE